MDTAHTSARIGSKKQITIHRVREGQLSLHHERDTVVTEEPLEIRLITPTEKRTLAVTMRTPGADFELAAGFLYSERILHYRDEVERISYCVDRTIAEEQRYNIVNVTLRQQPARNLHELDRHFIVSSACGVCGKTSIDTLELDGLTPLTSDARVSVPVFTRLTSELRKAQQLFATTGGLHAAALFDSSGSLLAVREDVGRHNAMDKLLGWALLEGKMPLDHCILLVSGRASFELVQKAVVARLPLFCAISAPSSLAVDLARRFGITLIGFLRDNNFNIYCGEERVVNSIHPDAKWADPGLAATDSVTDV